MGRMMHKKNLGNPAILLLLIFVIMITYGCKGENHKDKKMKTQTHVIMLGASVGQAWDLPGLPARSGNTDYTFETLTAWQFDKSEILEEALMRPKRKFRMTRTYFLGFLKPSPKAPDILVIKECSAYFPGDLAAYRRSIENWVQAAQEKKRKVILATVVPVTEKRAASAPGKMEGIREFNDWIRHFTREKGLILLDLEAALRTDPKHRFLRDDLTSGDGSHLNRKAYDILDPLMLKAVEKASVYSP